jgi:hypothetical protein
MPRKLKLDRPGKKSGNNKLEVKEDGMEISGMDQLSLMESIAGRGATPRPPFRAAVPPQGLRQGDQAVQEQHRQAYSISPAPSELRRWSRSP